MRLLFVSFVGNNRWSGMGKWTHSIAAECERRGHRTAMWWDEDFPRMRRLGRLAALLFPVAVAIRLFRARNSFDVVVLHEPSGYWYGWLRTLRVGVPPVVLISHGVESRRFYLLLDATRRGLASVGSGSRWKTPLLRLWQADGALRRADHVICLSSYDRSYLTRQLGIAPDRVSMMINGADPLDFQPGKDREFAARVLFIGGWLDAKGSRTLPRIWSRVIERVPHARLTLLGTGIPADIVSGDFSPELRGSVQVIPRVTETSEVARYLASHDLFLLPSLNEGSPLALLEAMTAGLPVVAGDAGGIPDIVRGEDEGLLFNPLDVEGGASQVVRALTDASQRARMAAGSLRRARELGWDQATDTLLTAVSRVLGGANGDSGVFSPAGPPFRPQHDREKVTVPSE